MAVANDDEVFPGGVTSELCLMHQAMKMGQTGVGQLERTKMKVIQNEFVEGKKLYTMVHRLAAFFSYLDRLRELHVHCGTTCPHIESTYDIPRLRKLLTLEYVKYGLKEFDMQQQAIEVDMQSSS